MEKLVRKISSWLVTFPVPKNWVLMLISFFLALFLWYFVVGEDKVDMNVTIPVEIVNMPRGLVISNKFKKQLEVTVSGPRSLIRAMNDQYVRRTIDLSSVEPGKFEVENRPDNMKMPRGISILRVQPQTLTLLLERELRKKLPVTPQLHGSPAKGFELLSVTLEPMQIEVAGPESVLGPESEILTNTIDISGLDASSLRQVTLALKPELVDLLGEQVVTARIAIEEKLVERVVPQIPVSFDLDAEEMAESGYSLQPSSVDIRAAIPVTLITDTEDLRTLFSALVPRDGVGDEALDLAPVVHVIHNGDSRTRRIEVLDVNPERVRLVVDPAKRKKAVEAGTADSDSAPPAAEPAPADAPSPKTKK